MIARTMTALLLLATASAAPACSGGDDIDCTYEDSCGGDPSGDWDVAGACAAPEEADPLPNCPQAVTTRTSALSGRWRFNENMDYSYELDTTMIYSVRAPLSCLQPTDDGQDPPPVQYATCEEIRGEGVICTTSADVCDCRLVSTTTNEQAGTWAAVDSTLTLSDDFGNVLASYDFCREDSKTLKLVPNVFDEVPTVIVLETH